ncbi:hypothetical protein NPIL_231681 [Nephila pilipes]|uniref:WAP domain-containing protein n=1 Tax=Nephila pilipes TaxID=299642 RepID=A0A8X6T8H5_NEPPI|nr:hypothetical protein NPIL_231681 [Nephila pilipes]
MVNVAPKRRVLCLGGEVLTAKITAVDYILVSQMLKLMCCTFALMFFLYSLNSSTTTTHEKQKCPVLVVGNCTSRVAQCCSSDQCKEGDVCCQNTCKLECLRDNPKDPNRLNPEVNLTQEECAEYEASTPEPL